MPSTIASSYRATPLRPWKCSLKGDAHASSIGCAPARNARHTRLAAHGCRPPPASPPSPLLLLLLGASAAAAAAPAAS